MLSGLARIILPERRHVFLTLSPSILVHLGATFAAAIIGLAIGLNLALGWDFLIMPSVMIVALLPLLIGGWGMREGTMVVGLPTVGVESADALLISTLFGLLSTAIGLSGGAPVGLQDAHGVPRTFQVAAKGRLDVNRR